MTYTFLLPGVLALLLTPINQLKAQEASSIWEESVTIPTYQVDQPDPNPRFYDGRITQGAQGRVYPYAMSDVLLQEKTDRSYRIIYLENEYVKISVIPELGGRIFTAVDKTNNYDFFYRQHVIKPALIGTLGKWISGGSEWNFPHHHKATTMMRMDSYIVENQDGSVTLWLAETERRHRFRITQAMTLYPDKSYLEMKVMPYNTSPFVHSFLYFANPAVHVDSTYQVIFPPNVEYVTQHAKREFIQWPIASGYYGSKNYHNVDISWWKNLATPVSFFAWNDEQNFFAGYDHGREAGVAYLSNHHTAPGMKFFTFGCGESGLAWDKRLTDSDGPYLELMAGVFSDNQPDYSWAQPYERKSATQYWFPVRELGGMNYANLNGALFLNTANLPDVEISINTTGAYENARAVLLAKSQQVWEEELDIDPGHPFKADFRVPEGSSSTDLTLKLVASDGSLLLNFQPSEIKGSEMPEEVKPPPPPDQIATVEELYFAGLRLNQFYNAQLDPMPYYMEALNRDPGNYLVNTQLGILDCKGFRWDQAEQRLRTALDRITYNHTRPRNGEAWYYQGISLRAQGKTLAAYDAFYRASWSLAWSGSSYYQLAELDCMEGDYETALEHIEHSIGLNGGNLKARNLKAILLRKLDKSKEALHLAESISREDPLDLVSRNELVIHGQDRTEFESIVMGEEETLLELTAFYGNIAAYPEAIDVLSVLDKSIRPGGSEYPMIYYYLAYYYARMGDMDKYESYAQLAATMPPDYCFPYRQESLQVLEYAISKNPEDASALYYLGNLLFDHQPDKAVSYWEKAQALDDSNAVLQRNLGLACSMIETDYEKAIEYYENALRIKSDPRIIYELDIIYEKANVDVEKRAELFEAHASVASGRVDALTRQVLVYIQSEKYNEAIKVLGENYFYRWEGGNEVREYYEDAYLLRGVGYISKGKLKKAQADFQAALEYPENLEEGRPEFDEAFARSYYYMGLVLELMGEGAAAGDYYRKAAAERTGHSEYTYYNILACQKLGEEQEAEKHIKSLEEYARRGSGDRFFAKFGERQSAKMKQAEQLYLQGLVEMAKDHSPEARTVFEKAIVLNPNHSWAKAHLGEIKSR
ncbi:MAG: DUF5107 domain-containing protein [Bacteroidota bacterium]